MEYKINNGKPTVFVTEKERELLKIQLSKYAKYLNSESHLIRESLILEVVRHHFKEANIYELERLRANIFLDSYSTGNINPYYRDLVTLNKGVVEVRSGDLFLSFAMYYNILEDEQKGQLALIEILKFHIINWIIDNDISTGEIPIMKSITVAIPPKRGDIFINVESEDFFKYFVTQVKEKRLTVKPILTEFYDRLKKGEGIYGVHCKKGKFASFWNKDIVPQIGSEFMVFAKNGELQLHGKSAINATHRNQFNDILSSYTTINL